MSGFESVVEEAAIAWLGEGLKRPECVLTTAKGEVFAGDHHSGIAEVGRPKRDIVGAPPGFLPNGVAMTRSREFLIANLGPGGGQAATWRAGTRPPSPRAARRRWSGPPRS